MPAFLLTKLSLVLCEMKEFSYYRSREITFGSDNHCHKKWKLLNHRSWQVRLVDGNFEAGKLGERPRANSNRADHVSFACSYARLLSFHFRMAPEVFRNCSWVKLTLTGEKKYLSDREIQLGDGGEGKRKAELVKLCQNAASRNQANLDCSRC